MSRNSDAWEKSIEDSLARINEALARTDKTRAVTQSTSSAPPSRRQGGLVGASALVTAFIVLAVATGQSWLFLPALAFGIAAGLLLARRLGEGLLRSDHAHIGMGATIAEGAVLDPGAVVEMGATVGAGATIRSGAVVRMGATIAERAVLESGVVVSWGATVHEDAVVGSGAVIGTGAEVMAHAHVPPGTRLLPGATFMASRGSKPGIASASAAGSARVDELPPDARASRIDTVCDRLEAELRNSPESVRAFLGGGTATVAALRRTCHDLLRRERSLREESSAEALKRLDAEKSVLEARISSSTDDAVRRSLEGAVTAIDEQRRQRHLLQRNADRLDAEITRLSWMLEGMAAQLVRLRSAAPQAGATSDPELGKSLVQLHEEIDAIADALEHVSSDVAPVAPISEPAPDQPQTSERPRVRE